MMRPSLCPVMRQTPGQDAHLPAPIRVTNQRKAARAACRGSARRLGLRINKFEQDENGAPQPVDGWYWSVSHTRGVVCGVVYPAPIGIDVERVQKRRQEIVRATATRAEYDLTGGFRWHNFTRIWSAKEAVLKKAGCGLQELYRCRLVAAPNPRSLVLFHRDRHHFVHQNFHHGHYVSISADVADDAEIRWDWWEKDTPSFDDLDWGALES